ncbi:hypothetical protein, partial [Streptococcus pneumoniae]|uniref:hypothetical protein n=1 Tax=Streptococcus pneumoniae TaxID=1313 RepID=UPI0018B0C188
LGASPLEKDAKWRDTYAANLTGLGGGYDSLRSVATKLTEAEAPLMSEADAKAAGIVRPWMENVHLGLARMANAAES